MKDVTRRARIRGNLFFVICQFAVRRIEGVKIVDSREFALFSELDAGITMRETVVDYSFRE
jgi:hypothetical protein